MTKCKTTLSVIFPYLCLLLPRRKDGVGDYLIYELYKIFCKDFATKKMKKESKKDHLVCEFVILSASSSPGEGGAGEEPLSQDFVLVT